MGFVTPMWRGIAKGGRRALQDITDSARGTAPWNQALVTTAARTARNRGEIDKYGLRDMSIMKTGLAAGAVVGTGGLLWHDHKIHSGIRKMGLNAYDTM